MSEKLVSIVIPTYKEAENIPLIAAQIDSVLNKTPYEVIFVDDDSQDGSCDSVAKLREEYPVRIIVRTKERGLSTAVIRGVEEATGQYVVVMDCDLSHPATAIPSMIDMLRADEADFVVGSRYIEGGSFDDDWGFFRLLNSKVATWLAVPLCHVKDPMSGFFSFERKRLKTTDNLAPAGYKIGLEIMVKGGFSRPGEHPIHFKDREFGESKLDFKEQLLYLKHLRRLYKYKFPTASEFIQFGLVGGTGFVLDSLIYFALQLLLGVEHTIARAISFWPAATWNWMLNRTVTFTHRKKTKKLKQWLSFLLTSLSGFVINFGSYKAMTTHITFFSEHTFLALVIGVLLGMGFNFMMARIFVFKELNDDISEEANSVH